jgi:hypothetical protein
MTIRAACFIATVLAAVGLATADTIELRDGSIRHGVVESRDSSQVRLRIDRDGISGSAVIPMSQIARIVLEVNPTLATLPGSPRQLTLDSSSPPAAATAPAMLVAPPPSEAEIAVYQSRGFLPELLWSATGNGPDDLERLPAGDRELWLKAVQADASKDLAHALDFLRALDSSMQKLPDGSQRLDAIARRQRQESFAFWMATVHWNVMSAKYSTAQFDLSDVRDVERPVLIGLLKEKTDPALEPLRSFFPPPDEKTGQPAPFKPAQLQNLTAANALDIKDKASFAAAVLLAQLKLEPDMPPMDRALVSNQLAIVNRILLRARDLEPAAKAAIVKAEMDRRATEEKARRDAAIAAQHRPVAGAK